MRVDIQVEIDDAGRTFVGCAGEWYYVDSDEVSDFLGWVIGDVVSE